MEAHVVTAADVPAVALTLAGVFFSDPVWAWAFPDPGRRHDQHVALWQLALEGSIDHGWNWTTGDYASATLWIPPGEPELTDPHAARLVPLLDDLLGDRADLVLDVFDRFDAAHPRAEPHFYLSLLGTHPDHRGQGTGMWLLRENLGRVDRSGQPAYLESTNPANVDRYRSVGFETIGTFALPTDGPEVTQMWRPAVGG